MSTSHAAYAEDLITYFLQQTHWEILARNWRRRGCELDIIARQGDLLAIVEVKYRARFLPYAADLSLLISRQKTSALRRGALLFLGENPQSLVQCVRVDLAVVSPSRAGKEQLPNIRYYDNVVSL
jgi:putative endonuclease